MRRFGNERGVALFLVLWVLMLLMVIAGEFCQTTRTEVNITRNFKEETEAYYIAEAGLNRAVRELVKNEVRPPSRTPAHEKLGNIFSDLMKSAKGDGSGADPGDETDEPEEGPGWRVGVDIPPVAFGGGEYKAAIGNESGKIDINRADEKFLKMMLDSFDLDEVDRSIIIDSILDWRDADDLHRLNGAEDDYYESLTPPYESRDAPFTSVEELLLVRGVTREIFFGGLKDMITVYSGESARPDPASRILGGLQQSRTPPRPATGGPIKINIAAASPQLLRALPSMTDEMLGEILEFRRTTGFTTMTEFSAIVGPEAYAAMAPLVNLKNSAFYTIRSEGRLKDNPVRREVEAMVVLDPRSKKRYRFLWRRDG